MVTITPIHSVLDRMIALSRAMDGTPFADSPNGDEGTTRQAIWFPAMDSYETEKAFVIELDIPGVHPENVDIDFEQNTLTIKGTRASRDGSKSELRVFSSERSGGSFSRALRLPQHVDAEKIEATHSNGVLTITVPKAASALPRKITVSVAK